MPKFTLNNKIVSNYTLSKDIPNDIFFSTLLPFISVKELIKAWTQVSKGYRYLIDVFLFTRQDNYSLTYQLTRINHWVDGSNFLFQPRNRDISSELVLRTLSQPLITPPSQRDVPATWLNHSRINGIKWLNQQISLPTNINPTVLLSLYQEKKEAKPGSVMSTLQMEQLVFYAKHLSPTQLSLFLPVLETHLPALLKANSLDVNKIIESLSLLVTHLSTLQIKTIVPLLEQVLTAQTSTYHGRLQVKIAGILADITVRSPTLVNVELLLTTLTKFMQDGSDREIYSSAIRMFKRLTEHLPQNLMEPFIQQLKINTANYLSNGEKAFDGSRDHALLMLELLIPHLSEEKLNGLCLLVQHQLKNNCDYSCQHLFYTLIVHCKEPQLIQLLYALPLEKSTFVYEIPTMLAKIITLLPENIVRQFAMHLYNQWTDKPSLTLQTLSMVGSYLNADQCAVILAKLLVDLLSSEDLLITTSFVKNSLPSNYYPIPIEDSQLINKTLDIIASFAENRAPFNWYSILNGIEQSLKNVHAGVYQNKLWQVWSDLIVNNVNPERRQEAVVFIQDMMLKIPLSNDRHYFFQAIKKIAACFSNAELTDLFTSAYNKLEKVNCTQPLMLLIALSPYLSDEQVQSVSEFLEQCLGSKSTNTNDTKSAALDLLTALANRFTPLQIGTLLVPLQEQMQENTYGVNDNALKAFIALAPRLSAKQHQLVSPIIKNRLAINQATECRTYYPYLTQLAPYFPISELTSLVKFITTHADCDAPHAREASLDAINELAPYWSASQRQSLIPALAKGFDWNDEYTRRRALNALLTLLLSADAAELPLYQAIISAQKSAQTVCVEILMLQLALDNWHVIHPDVAPTPIPMSTEGVVTSTPWEAQCLNAMTLPYLKQARANLLVLTPVPNRYFALVNSELDKLESFDETMVDKTTTYRSLLELLYATKELPSNEHATLAVTALWEAKHQALISQHPRIESFSSHYQASLPQADKTSPAIMPAKVQSFDFLKPMKLTHLIEFKTNWQKLTVEPNAYFTLVNKELERIGGSTYGSVELKEQKYRSLLELLYLTLTFTDDKAAILVTLEQWKKSHYQLISQHRRHGFFNIFNDDTLSKQCVDQLINLAQQQDRPLSSPSK